MRKCHNSGKSHRPDGSCIRVGTLFIVASPFPPTSAVRGVALHYLPQGMNAVNFFLTEYLFLFSFILDFSSKNFKENFRFRE